MSWKKDGFIGLIVGAILILANLLLSSGINEGVMGFTFNVLAPIFSLIVYTILPDIEIAGLAIIALLYFITMAILFFLIGVMIGLIIKKVKK